VRLNQSGAWWDLFIMSGKPLGLFILASILMITSTAVTWERAPEMAFLVNSSWPYVFAFLLTATDIGAAIWWLAPARGNL
jgi:hypothetical protein